MKHLLVMTAHSVLAAIVGGSLSSVFAALHVENLVETIVLSMAGTTVSFVLSMLLDWLVKQREQE